MEQTEIRAHLPLDATAKNTLQEDAMHSFQQAPATRTSIDGTQGNSATAHEATRWTEEHAADWYHHQGWLVGSNFLPSDAINQLEMWQKDTFDPKEIDRELGWAEKLGMNTMRVFLQDLLWQDDPEGFKSRIDQFLTIADKHHIRPVFVLFDSCWDPNPHLGKQHDPVPGITNSGWVQSPGRAELTDKNQYGLLESYVKGVLGNFKNDDRILMWDLWNEPDNKNENSYGAQEPANKIALIQDLLPKVFDWARSENPSQPLTSAVWSGDWSSPAKLDQMQKIQLENSDVITFHNYDVPSGFEQRVNWLQSYHRPIICTEYMARPRGSTFNPILSIAKKDNVGVINWGFVLGKSQTCYPWDSWQHPYSHPPDPWFHDILKSDGTPYRPAEVDYIRKMTGVSR